MGKLTDIDVTGKVSGKSGSVLGAAHEHLVTGLLMRLGFDVSVCSVTTANYDLLVQAFINGPESPERLLKAQVKTCQGSLGLTGGGRGGVDRITISGVKTYKYTENHCDLMIGVSRNDFDLYLFPIRFAYLYKTSVSLKKIGMGAQQLEYFVELERRLSLCVGEFPRQVTVRGIPQREVRRVLQMQGIMFI